MSKAGGGKSSMNGEELFLYISHSQNQGKWMLRLPRGLLFGDRGESCKVVSTLLCPGGGGNGKRWPRSWVKTGARSNRRWGAGSQETSSGAGEQKSLISIFISICMKSCSAMCNVILSSIFQ